MIRGTVVTLYEEVQTGTDMFNRPVFETARTYVPNVLVSPATAEAITNELSISGKHLVYELCIPKGDTNDWEDKKVAFFGQTFHTFGPVEEWIEAMVPLSWNRKVKVERYG